MKKAPGWLPSRKPAWNVLIFFCCPGFLIFRFNFYLLLLLVGCVWRMRRMLAVSLIRLLPTQSYDNWINPALILFLLNIIIIILVIFTKFSLQNIKSPNIIRPHFSTSQKNLMLWTMSTMIIWQKPGGPRPHLNRKAQISQNWKMIRGHRSHRKPTYYWDQIVRPPF